MTPQTLKLSPDRQPRAHAWPVPRPRRFTVVLGVLASAGVILTSFRAAPAAVVIPLAVAWFAAFACGALAPRGPVVLSVLAGLVKAVTAALIVWHVTQPHSPLGPRSPLDWIPLGALNAATGIWLLRVIRREAR